MYNRIEIRVDRLRNTYVDNIYVGSQEVGGDGGYLGVYIFFVQVSPNLILCVLRDPLRQKGNKRDTVLYATGQNYILVTNINLLLNFH